jgi:hypothetical protein
MHLYSFRVSLVAVLLPILIFAGRANAQQLIGTFNVNYLTNTAGCGPTSPNPYFCIDPLGPGPYFINVPPGRYEVVTVSSNLQGGNPVVWDGNASSGVSAPLSYVPGSVVMLNHTFGQIVLFQFDWYPYDNDPNHWIIVSLYQLNTSGSLGITTTSLPDGNVNSVYTPQTLIATGGTPPYTWSISSGATPDGINLSGNVISGTLTAGGTFNFTVEVTDSAGAVASQALSITVDCTITPAVPAWTQFTGTPYDQSYITTTRYATLGSTPVSQTGVMQLQNGTSTFRIPLASSTNSLYGLATLLSSVPGANAAIGGSSGNYYLSVYNKRCEVASCFPRSANTLQLCDGPCATGSNILTPKLMNAYGCAVTALSIATSHVGVSSIQERTGPQALSPQEFNEFMSNTIDLTSLGGQFDAQGNVDWFNTPRYIGNNQQRNKFTFDGSVALDHALCVDNLPVIEQVTSPHGTHFVVVTGKQGTATDGSQYTIQDPGYSQTTLQSYYQRSPAPQTVGVVRDPTDMSELNLSVGDDADLLVTDSSGRRTGFDTAAGTVHEIPKSAYLRTQVADDVTGETTTGLTHSIQVLTPTAGPYALTVSGVAQGLYNVSVHFYSEDGTAGSLTLVGVANNGSSSTFQIEFSPTSTTGSTVSRMATFASTLADIANSLQLALMDNSGIANALSAKLNAASTAATNGDHVTASNILNAFKNQVSAQTGKHIIGVAPQVLQEDADSLIHQNGG